jgi:xylan 1,4-beta-xylosidase
MIFNKGNSSRLVAVIFFFCGSLYSGAQQLVLRGDYPDPSVIKIGDTYWASATTSNWAPAYPILKSKDLFHWTTVTHVFTKLPEWADHYFWAPELSYENGKVYVYYAAYKKGGNLCIGVASADRPEGPYTDHGTLVCQEDGSIDAFPMRDEKGKLFLIWKEDANSVGRPTPIWAQQLNEARTGLIGNKKELFRNDVPWEKNLVEGVSMVRHGEYFYAFYAAAGCCGAKCTYGVGVARAKSLLGPWEKNPANPVLTTNDKWNCPGHGTPVDKDGKHYFMYHAYDKNTTVFTGREGLLAEYKFTPDGWIEFVKETTIADVPVKNVSDHFDGKILGKEWQWSVFQQPKYTVKSGELFLNAAKETGNFLAQKSVTGDYIVSVKLDLQKSIANGGIAIIGDEKNLVTLVYRAKAFHLVKVKDGKEIELSQKPLLVGKQCYFQIRVKLAIEASFYISTDGKKYFSINSAPIDISYLPPWDRAVRVGLIAQGENDKLAVFDDFKIDNQKH